MPRKPKQVVIQNDPLVSPQREFKPFDFRLFENEVCTVAEALIGCEFYCQGVGGRIIETEAYHPEDPASHSFRGYRPRLQSLFGPAGHAYIYRSHGLHWCLCFVCGPVPGAAVLLRALEPIRGIEHMQERRGLLEVTQLCSGPGKLTEALGLNQADDGLSLQDAKWELRSRSGPVAISIGPRIGITKAVEKRWRYGLSQSPYLSRPFPKPRVSPG